MKKKYFNILIIIFCLYLIIEIIINKGLVLVTVNSSLKLWLNSLVGIMFPFFIISDILINYNIINYIPKIIKRSIAKLFNISEQLVTVIFLSLLSGFPSSARVTRNLYDKGLISNKEAAHILTFTHFANPLFILGTLNIFFNDKIICYIVMIVHYLSNILVGISFKHTPTSYTYKSSTTKYKSQSFGIVLITSIKKSIDTLLSVVGIITCFAIVSSITVNRLNLSINLKILLQGILEITNGINTLSLTSCSDLIKIIVTSSFLAFGGISIQLQILSQIIDTDIDYRPCLVARIYQVILSIILSFIIYYLFKYLII